MEKNERSEDQNKIEKEIENAEEYYVDEKIDEEDNKEETEEAMNEEDDFFEEVIAFSEEDSEEDGKSDSEDSSEINVDNEPEEEELQEEELEEDENADTEQENEDSEEEQEMNEFDLEEELEGQKHFLKKKILMVTGGVVGALAVIYIGTSVFFMNHFYVNTEINGHDFSMKTSSDVETYIKKQVAEYTLSIQEKNDVSETIAGKDIELAYKPGKEIEDVLKKQNGFLWPKGFFSKKSTAVTVGVSYNEELLNSQISQLESVNREQIAPVSAYPKYDGEKFAIEPEVIGTAVDMDVLKEKINKNITEFKPELDMEKEHCYMLPKYTSESPEVKAACDEMNKYLQASITYTMREPVVVDRALISNWLSVDENMAVVFNEEGVRQWLAEFGDAYDTVGTTRTITTPIGKTVEVSGGTYGWSIDEEAEFPALLTSIRNGEVISKEPAYFQTAASHELQDWGTTYVDVDISAQHIWYIVNGAVALETDVVTGKPIPEMETTLGVYYILEKSLNKTLVGEEDPKTGKPIYETPVAYWMRITWSGIGFHDATWQSAFGGTRYMDGYGSHGCINMPIDQAGALYSMIPEKTPVVVHN